MAGPFPPPKQFEILSGLWRPKWDWSPRYMMFTSYWPSPDSFVAFGTNGEKTLAVRGTWVQDLGMFLKSMEQMKVVNVRIARYPESDEVELVPPDADSPTELLPATVSTNPTDASRDQGPGPPSSSMAVTVPHWSAVARAFQRLLRDGLPGKVS